MAGVRVKDLLPSCNWKMAKKFIEENKEWIGDMWEYSPLVSPETFHSGHGLEKREVYNLILYAEELLRAFENKGEDVETTPEEGD